MLSSNEIGTERNDYNVSSLFDKGDNLENGELFTYQQLVLPTGAKISQKYGNI